MATVARRDFRSSPHRDAGETWSAIVEMLSAPGSEARLVLVDVAGIAASIIADRACSGSPIIVSCEGPQTRIYCLYDDDAIDGSDSNEDPLGYDPLKGDWTVSLPCEADDLEWVSAALARKGERIFARDCSSTRSPSSDQKSANVDLALDIEGFLSS